MSSAPAAQRYFCHQCERTVSLAPSSSSDLSCPICLGGFLEEFEIPDPNPNPNSAPPPPFLPRDPFSSAVFPPSPASFDVSHPADLFSLLGFDPVPSRPSPDHFNPVHFLQSYFQSLMAGGANIHFVVESGPGPAAAALGDYFVGPGLEQLIQHLMDNDPNRYGTPPASRSVVESLPDVRISQETLAADDDDEAQCAICKDAFEIGAEAKQMPCKHIYHKECIVPWLELHNSCPVCRFELPTDDPDYESRKEVDGPARTTQLGQASGSGGVGDSGGGRVGTEVDSPRERTREKRFRISLPWPFAVGSTNDGDNGSEAGEFGGSGSGNASSGGRGSQGHGQNMRQDELD